MKQSLAALLCVSLLSLSACDPDHDVVKPQSPTQKAVLVIHSHLQSTREALRSYRDLTSIPSEKLGVEVVMTILSSSVLVMLSDIYYYPGTDMVNLGRLEALDAELDLAESADVLALLPPDLAQATRQNIEQLHADKVDAEKVMKFSTVAPVKLNADWISFLQSNQADATINQNNLETLRVTINGSAAGTASGLMIPAFNTLTSLNEGYLSFVTDTLNAKTVDYTWWAKLKTTARRTDAMTQLSYEWMTSAPLSSLNLPPEPLNEINGGPGSGSCYPRSHGDEPGVMNGGVGIGSSSIKDVSFAGGNSTVPPPTPVVPCPSSSSASEPATTTPK